MSPSSHLWLEIKGGREEEDEAEEEDTGIGSPRVTGSN